MTIINRTRFVTADGIVGIDNCSTLVEGRPSPTWQRACKFKQEDLFTYESSNAQDRMFTPYFVRLYEFTGYVKIEDDYIASYQEVRYAQ